MKWLCFNICYTSHMKTFFTYNIVCLEGIQTTGGLIQFCRAGENMGKTIYTVKYDSGSYTFLLYDILDKKKISHNRFQRDTSTEYGTMKRYALGLIQKVDLDLIDRWCKYLDCKFEDIIRYNK